MEKALVKAKGRIVIPAKLRRRFGIKKRTQVFVYEKAGEIVVRPITDGYIESMAGVTGTKGKLLKALKEEKTKGALVVRPASRVPDAGRTTVMRRAEAECALFVVSVSGIAEWPPTDRRISVR